MHISESSLQINANFRDNFYKVVATYQNNCVILLLHIRNNFELNHLIVNKLQRFYRI